MSDSDEDADAKRRPFRGRRPGSEEDENVTHGENGDIHWQSQSKVHAWVPKRKGLPPTLDEWRKYLRGLFGPLPDQNRKAGDST